MDYRSITTLDEAKAYLKTLWRPMESECVLKNLKKILNFLQSPAEEVCFVNMQEKYLPFYYMIVADEEFLQTSFLSDQCKVIANNILHILDANRSSFTWEVSFSRQIAGIPVIFTKVYTQPCQKYPTEQDEKPIRLAFKETWIKTTLKFIKSSRLILKYPEMPRREAQYLYKGILKLNEDELGADSIWNPVWEAMNIFKLRYQYIVSLHPTAFDYLKSVHFEKVILQRKTGATDDKNPTLPLDMNNPEFETDVKDTADKDKSKSSSNETANDVLLPVVNHDELIKTLLEMNVSRTGSIVYSIKINESNTGAKASMDKLENELDQASDDVIAKSLSDNKKEKCETGAPRTNMASPDKQMTDVSLTVVVQNGVKRRNEEYTDSNVPPANGNNANKKKKLTYNPANYQNDTEYIDDLHLPYSKCDRTKDGDANKIDANDNTVESESQSNIQNKNDVEVLKKKVACSGSQSVNRDSIECQIIEPSNIKNADLCDRISIDDDEESPVIEISDTEVESYVSDSVLRSDSANENPFYQQIIKLQRQGRPLYLKEANFISTNNRNGRKVHNNTTYDATLKKKVEIINSKHKLNDIYVRINSLYKKPNSQKTPKASPAPKAVVTVQTKKQKREESRVRRKRRLADSVSPKFILRSFKAILDFVDDDSTASMEMVGLNLLEFNFLKKLRGFSPDIAPIELVFPTATVNLATELFTRLKIRNDFTLQIDWGKNGNVQKHKSQEHGDVRIRKENGDVSLRAITFTKIVTKKNRKITNSKMRNMTTDTNKDKCFEELRKPKSILEKMCLITLAKTGIALPVSGMSPERNKLPRSSSVSPSRCYLSPTRPRPEHPNSKSKDLENISDNSLRTPAVTPNENIAATMKAKLLEGLAVPLESDKAMRMMRLMGWKGGALGVRGGGLIEPIQPRLNVPRGVGLGHISLKPSNISINKPQSRVMYCKPISADTTEALATDRNKRNMPESNENDKRKDISINKDVTNEKDNNNVVSENEPNILTSNTIHYVQKSLPISVNNNVIMYEYKDLSAKNVASNSSDDVDAWPMKSKVVTDSKEKIEGRGWQTNESVLYKIQDRHTASNVRDNEMVRSNIAADSKGKIEGISRQANESVLHKSQDGHTASNVRDNETVKSNIAADSKGKIEGRSRQVNESVLHKSQDGHTASNVHDNETVKSNIAADSKGKIEGRSWQANESVLHKIQDRHTASNVRDNEAVKSNIAADAKGKIEGRGGLNNESKQNMQDRSVPCDTTDKFKDKNIVHKMVKNIETHRLNHENILGLQKVNDYGQISAANDEKLQPYNQETNGRHFSERTQFLVHLLNLLQSCKETSTVVSYFMEPCQMSIGFIDSTIRSLNRRAVAAPTLTREARIIEACTREMKAHNNLVLSYRLVNRILTLIKTDSSNITALQVRAPYKEFDLETTCTIHDARFYTNIPEETKGVVRTKIITNRVIQEFVKSGDEAQVYFYETSSADVRLYVMSLISLLNRQMTQYQLGLGITEHQIFRELLDATKNFCLIFRFDTPESYFTKLQLVKVDLNKRCRICQVVNQVIIQQNQSVVNKGINESSQQIDDIELYPNTFSNNENDTMNKSDNGYITDKGYDKDYSDKAKADKEYFIAENRLDSVTYDKTNYKYEYGNYRESNYKNNIKNITQKEVCNIEERGIKNKNQYSAKRNALDDEIYSDNQYGPKRIKKNESNPNLINVNMKLNTTEYYAINTNLKGTEKILPLSSGSSHKTSTECRNIFRNTAGSVPTNLITILDTVPADVYKNTLIDTKVDLNQETVRDDAIEPNNLNLRIPTDVGNWPRNILIVHYNYPKCKIDANSAMQLQSIIYEAIKNDRCLPHLKCYGLKNDGIVYTCYDYKSYMWLYEKLQRYYKLLDYELELEITHIIDLKLNTFIKVNIDVIFKNIESFYDSIKTSSWKLIQTKELADYSVFTLEIDDCSLKSIRDEHYSLFIGIDKADISVKYD